MQALNIAIFASSFHPHLGGVEELVRQLAHAYQKRGHRVIIITNRYPETLPVYEEFEGLALHRVAMRAPDEIRGASAYWKSLARYHFSRNASHREIEEILCRYKVDLLHIQCISSSALYASQAAKTLGLPLVVTAQGELTMDVNRTFQLSRTLNDWMREAVLSADFVTGCSQKTLDDLQQHLQVSLAGKSRPIYNGANLSDFAAGETFSAPRPYCLAIGRLAWQKGFDVLLRSWASVQDQPAMQPYDLILAGDGPERANLENQARELGVGERVVFYGRADRDGVIALFKGSSFVALPSRADEGFPLVGVETMAAGKALVATPTGGLPEIVRDEISALIVPKEDEHALAAAILRVAGDADLRRRLENAVRELAGQFDWPAIADQYLELYGEVLAKHDRHQKCRATVASNGHDARPQHAAENVGEVGDAT